ncbi:MAG: N-acetyltransferase family protein [Myxococcota bacterium]
MDDRELQIREAIDEDAGVLIEIYRPFVEEASVSFETEPPSMAEMAARIRKAHLWLVAESEGQVVGYAYGGAHRSRAAYRHSVETSIYLHSDVTRRGLGSSLYGQLLHQLSRLGFCNAFAGTTLPNPASEAFHGAMGFSPIGTFERVGFKFGRWHDVRWWQKRLRERPL